MKPMKKDQQDIITGLEGLQHTLPAPLVEMVCKLLDNLDFDDKGQLSKSKFIHDICFDTYHLTMRFWVATLAGHVLCRLPAESEAQHQYQRKIYETLQNCALGNWVQDLLKQVEASKDWLAPEFEPLYQALTSRHRLPTGITAFVDAAQKFLPHHGPASKSWPVFLCEWMPFYRNKIIGHGACRYQESDYQLLTLAFLKAIIALLKRVQQHWPQKLVLLRQTENQPRSGGITPAGHPMQCQIWKTGERQPKRQSGQSDTALYANRLYLAKATDNTPGKAKEQAKKWVWHPLVDYGALMVIQAQGAHSAFYFLNALPERQAEQEFLEMSQGFFWLAPLLEKRLQQAFASPVLRLQPRPLKPDPLRERLQVQHWIRFALRSDAKGLNLEPQGLLQRAEALIVLEGPGGAGKSGAMSEAYKQALINWQDRQGPCPVFIRLGLYRESKDLTQLIRDALSCPQWHLSHSQPLLLFCDGLNEVMPGLRIRVVEDLRYLLEHNPKHRLIVSGRNEDGELEQLLDEAPLLLTLPPPESEWVQNFLRQEGETALARWLQKESTALQQLRLSPFIALVLLELWREHPFQPEQSFSNGLLIQGLLTQMLAREQQKQGHTAAFVKQSREALAELAYMMQERGVIYADQALLKKVGIPPKIQKYARTAGILIHENQDFACFYHQLILELLAAEHLLRIELNWSEKIEPLIWRHRAVLERNRQHKIWSHIGQQGAMASLESRVQSLSLLLDLPLRDEEAIPLLEGLGHWLYQQVEVELNAWVDGFSFRQENEMLTRLQCIQTLIQHIQTCQYPAREQHLMPQVIVPWLKRLEPHWYETSDPGLQAFYAGQKNLAFANPLHFQLLRAFQSSECLTAALELVQKYPHEALLGQEGNLVAYQYRQGLTAFLLAQPGGLKHMLDALCAGQPEWEAFLQEVPLALRSRSGLPDTALSNYYVFFEDISESYNTITKISANNPLLVNKIAKRKLRNSKKEDDYLIYFLVNPTPAPDEEGDTDRNHDFDHLVENYQEKGLFSLASLVLFRGLESAEDPLSYLKRIAQHWPESLRYAFYDFLRGYWKPYYLPGSLSLDSLRSDYSELMQLKSEQSEADPSAHLLSLWHSFRQAEADSFQSGSPQQPFDLAALWHLYQQTGLASGQTARWMLAFWEAAATYPEIATELAGAGDLQAALLSDIQSIQWLAPDVSQSLLRQTFLELAGFTPETVHACLVPVLSWKEMHQQFRLGLFQILWQHFKPDSLTQQDHWNKKMLTNAFKALRPDSFQDPDALAFFRALRQFLPDLEAYLAWHFPLTAVEDELAAFSAAEWEAVLPWIFQIEYALNEGVYCLEIAMPSHYAEEIKGLIQYLQHPEVKATRSLTEMVLMVMQAPPERQKVFEQDRTDPLWWWKDPLDDGDQYTPPKRKCLADLSQHNIWPDHGHQSLKTVTFYSIPWPDDWPEPEQNESENVLRWVS